MGIEARKSGGSLLGEQEVTWAPRRPSHNCLTRATDSANLIAGVEPIGDRMAKPKMPKSGKAYPPNKDEIEARYPDKKTGTRKGTRKGKR